jgi:predicted RNA-binding protein with PIN domain
MRILDRRDLEQGRAALIGQLALYKKARSLHITVIFDGWNRGGLSESQTIERGIRVVFSRRGQKADAVIIRRAKEMGEKAMVVTSDRQIQLEARRYHATVIPCEEFELRMEMISHGDENGMRSAGLPDGTEKKGTRKKGPARRLPKSLRKTRRRIEKL